MTTTTIPDQPFGIRHVITAGQQFTGAASGGAMTLADGVFKYATSAAGGLFDPTALALIEGQGSCSYEVLQVEVEFGGQSSWTLHLLDADDNAVLVLSGTTETDLLHSTSERLVLLPGEKLKLVTTGASAAMRATVKLRRLREVG